MRRLLDGLYLTGGVVAAIFTVAMLAIIVLQMIARWTGSVFPGATDYAGYCMAASAFFAFAYALNRGAHIRVSLLLNHMGRARAAGEIWCFTLGAIVSTYLAWYAVKGVWFSRQLNDISQGLDATPIWIPQLSMAIGSVLLAICFWDNLARQIFTGRHGIESNVVGD